MKNAMSGRQVEAARLRLGLIQREFGERLGVSERTVCRWEKYGCGQTTKMAIESLT